MNDRPAQASLTLPPTVSGGRFEVASKLGEGGMATVYRALDRKTGEWCALKVLLPKFSERPNIRARFAAEAEAMLRISHRNVIHVFDVNTNGTRPFFAMELAEGGCLVDWVESYGAMPSRMACDVAIQICKGIGAAHRQGVIHRDIKPHNILVNRRGVCKITDFGIAQFDDDAASLTQTGSVMGTLGYIAPEQRANAKDVDERTDVYSIGATLFTLLTARTTMDLFFADQEPEMLEGVAEPLIPVILKATRYRREDRYESVRAMAKALYHAKASLPEDPPETPSIVLTGESVEGTALRNQNTTFEPADRSIISRASAQGTSTDSDDEPTAATQLATRFPSAGPGGERAPDGERAPSGAEPSRVPATPRAARSDSFNSDSFDPAAEGPLTDERQRLPSLAPGDADGRPRSMPPLPREALLQGKRAQEPLVDWGRVVRRTVAVASPLLAIIFLLAAFATWGAGRVDAERNDAIKARVIYFEAVEREEALVEELAVLGAPQAPLGQAWTAMIEAEPDARVALTERFLRLADQQLLAHSPTHASSSRLARSKEVRQRLSRIEDTRRVFLKQQAEWVDAVETSAGSFAVWLGIVNAPAEAAVPDGAAPAD